MSLQGRRIPWIFMNKTSNSKTSTAVMAKDQSLAATSLLFAGSVTDVLQCPEEAGSSCQ